jgi:DNA-binding MarR family transcriptional regulator
MPQTPRVPQTLTGQDIGEAEGAVRALLEHVLAGTGTTADEYVVLRVVAFRGPWKSLPDLRDYLAGQRQLRLDATTAASLLAGLEARGLLTGSPVQLTPEGAALHAKLGRTVAETTKRLYGELDADDLATAHRVLADVVQRADRLRQAS